MHTQLKRSAEVSWQSLTVCGGRQPGFHTMTANQDDGDEQFSDFDLWLGLSGSCTVHLLGQNLELRAGRAILIPAGIRARQFTGPSEELLMMWSHFDCVVSGQRITDASQYVDAANLRLTLPGLPTIALLAEVDSAGLSEKLYRIRNRPADDLTQLMLSIVHMDVIRHMRQAHLGMADFYFEERLERATAYLEHNLHKPISLAEVARHVSVSPETLGRLFRACYRVSPIRYLTRLRMARARELLQDRRYNISEVARACGYASLQYFSRAFAREYGLPPSVFRQRLPLIP